jgi:hypothetical protein
LHEHGHAQESAQSAEFVPEEKELQHAGRNYFPCLAVCNGDAQAAGGGLQEAGGRKQAAGSRRQEAGGRRQEAGGKSQNPEVRMMVPALCAGFLTSEFWLLDSAFRRPPPASCFPPPAACLLLPAFCRLLSAACSPPPAARLLRPYFAFRIYILPLKVVSWISGPPPLINPYVARSNCTRYLPCPELESCTIGLRDAASTWMSKSL